MGLDITLYSLEEPNEKVVSFSRFNHLLEKNHYEPVTDIILTHSHPKFILTVPDYQELDWDAIYAQIFKEYGFDMSQCGASTSINYSINSHEQYTVYAKRGIETSQIRNAPIIKDVDGIDAFNLLYSPDLFACEDIQIKYNILTPPEEKKFVEQHEVSYQRKGVEEEFYNLFDNCVPCFDFNTILYAGNFVDNPQNWNDEFVKRFTTGESYLVAWW